MTQRRGTSARRALFAILIAAAALRVVFGGWVVGLDAVPKGDEADYHAIATELVAGHGFCEAGGHPTARRPPLYPASLAALYAVTGVNVTVGRVMQLVLGVLLVALTAAVARRYFGSTAALIAAGLAALNPFLTFISGYLLTENLFMVWMLTALWLAPDPRAMLASWPRALGCAGAFGFAALTRPTGLPLLVWTVVVLLVVGRASWRARVVRALGMSAVFALILFPWYARNASVMGGWVLTTHGGITFYQGNNDKVAKIPSWRGGVAPLAALPRNDLFAGLSEVERDRVAWRLGGEYLRHNGRDVPGLVAWKLVRFWRLRSDMGLSGIRSGWWFSRDTTLGRLAASVDVGFVYALPVISLFLVGLWMTRRRWRELVLPYGVVVVHTAVAVVFFGSLRGRLPVEPILCMFAGGALAGLGGALRRR